MLIFDILHHFLAPNMIFEHLFLYQIVLMKIYYIFIFCTLVIFSQKNKKQVIGQEGLLYNKHLNYQFQVDFLNRLSADFQQVHFYLSNQIINTYFNYKEFRNYIGNVYSENYNYATLVLINLFQKHNLIPPNEIPFNSNLLQNNTVELRQEIILKDIKIKSLNTKNEIQKKQLDNTLLALRLVTYLVIPFLLLVFVLNKNKLTRKLKNTNQEINDLNSKQITANNEKEVLLKEIHHRVKNNLQLIMSLINIQALYAQNNTIQDFIDKCQTRITSMALIHQNLYLSENFALINFQIYLEVLVEHLRKVHSEPKLIININTNDINFDLDTAIPLGLIINEIVSNSLEHAFPEDNNSQIQISIHELENNWFELSIGDNGTGLNQNIINKSFGLELVSLLVVQLRGEIIQTNQKGTNYKIKFKHVE